MEPQHLSLLFILALSFTVIAQSSLTREYPLSWDVWYHLRISRQFSEGQFWWDTGSFGPEGRAHTYPPLFHAMTALIYKTTGVPLPVIAQSLTPLLYTLVILTFYFLTATLLNRKIALFSCLVAAVSPLLLDRGLTYTPESLSFIFINGGLYFFWHKKWKFAGILGGLLVLTHGLSSVAFFFIISMYTLCSFLVLKKNYWFLLFKVCTLSLVIPAVWALHSPPAFIPKGFAYPLNLYPEKLGSIQLGLAFLALAYLSKNKKSVFVLSFAGILFLLSQYSLVLPYRFTEFLVFPVCMLAGTGLYHILAHPQMNQYIKSSVIVTVFLLSFAQGYWSVEKYQPVVTTEEAAAFSWLKPYSVQSTVMCEWRTAPLLAFFSENPPLKGAYQFGAPHLTERTVTTVAFYTEYSQSICVQYDITYVYFGIEERAAGYDSPPFDRVFSTTHTGIYHC